ncbi:hypothetical protein [Cellulosimicrobium protaetiae]|uniref:Uncharacterized protein n=1 Tax=Cellulosimicrobium protaetiae TaxID=2587808 RepID=A0A6M5UKV1_9MICO|nr:hypothetical protein [Cellulosimicrobium protaetiae]QJW37379.1 hypothetical protein FIC82_015535 [Cellulosimicrobium protaetiae]
MPSSAPRRGCPACGRALAANPDGSWPPHLDASSTAVCHGQRRTARRGAARTDAAPSGTPTRNGAAPTAASPSGPDPDALAETPRRRARDETDEDRPTYLERREARFRESAILDLDEGPAGEDLDDTLYRARESRGGLPTLGSRRR